MEEENEEVTCYVCRQSQTELDEVDTDIRLFYEHFCQCTGSVGGICSQCLEAVIIELQRHECPTCHTRYRNVEFVHAEPDNEYWLDVAIIIVTEAFNFWQSFSNCCQNLLAIVVLTSNLIYFSTPIFNRWLIWAQSHPDNKSTNIHAILWIFGLSICLALYSVHISYLIRIWMKRLWRWLRFGEVDRNVFFEREIEDIIIFD